MTRRFWLRGLVVALWSQIVAVALRLAGIRAAPSRLGRHTAEASEVAGLWPPEVDALLAFAEVLVGGGGLPPAARSDLLAHIEETARARPEQLASYRATVVLLDRLAGGRFALLEIADRMALISRHRLDARGVPSDEDIGALGPEAAAVRRKVVPDLINGYWRSPAGWAAVGYEIFPGRCGDLARYTRSET